jgi:hypothetical protein
LLKTITLIALLVAVTLSVDVAARFNGAFAIAVLMRCIAVYGTVAIALLGGACCVYCYWQRDKFDRYDRIG